MLADLLLFHLKLYIWDISTHQYIVQRRQGHTKFPIRRRCLKSQVRITPSKTGRSCLVPYTRTSIPTEIAIQTAVWHECQPTLCVKNKTQPIPVIPSFTSLGSDSVVLRLPHYQTSHQKPATVYSLSRLEHRVASRIVDQLDSTSRCSTILRQHVYIFSNAGMPPNAHEQGARLQQHRSDRGGTLFRIFSTAPALRFNAVIPEPLVPESTVTETSQGALDPENPDAISESRPVVHTDINFSNASQVMHKARWNNPKILFINDLLSVCLLGLAKLCL